MKRSPSGTYAVAFVAEALLQYPISNTLVEFTETLGPGILAPWGVNSAYLILLTGTAYSLKQVEGPLMPITIFSEWELVVLVETRLNHHSTINFSPLRLPFCSFGALLQAAEGNRLNSRTYQRLNLALLLWGAAPLLNCLYQLDAFSAPYLPAFYAALGLPTLAVAATALRSSVAPEEDLVQGSLEDFKNGIDLLGKKTSLGQYLSFNFILNFLVGGSFAFSPRTPLPLPRTRP